MTCILAQCSLRTYSAYCLHEAPRRAKARRQ